jgi:RHS repeat-associated protein
VARSGQANGQIDRYIHPDWLGSGRVKSGTTAPTFGGSQAFAPFGEIYAVLNGFDSRFAGMRPDMGGTSNTGLSDTPNRELYRTQGRWISPDPAGLNGVELMNPQTWNRYAYVANSPLGYIDPTGLQYQCPTPSAAICQGGYTLGTSYFFNFFSTWDPFGGVSTFVPGENGDASFWVQTGMPLPFRGGGGNCYFALANPCQSAANNGQQPNPSKKNSPACQQAKAQLSSTGHQLSALDSSLRHDYFKNQLAAAGVGCVAGMIGGEAIESPLIGTPAAVGNCAVGAVGGVSWNNIQYAITNWSAIRTEASLVGQEAKAVANVISACY